MSKTLVYLAAIAGLAVSVGACATTDTTTPAPTDTVSPTVAPTTSPTVSPTTSP